MKDGELEPSLLAMTRTKGKGKDRASRTELVLAFALSPVLMHVRRKPEGDTWVFFRWVCAARDSKLAPRSKKKVALKLIPRSRIRPKTDNPF